MTYRIDKYEHEKFASGKWVTIEGTSRLKVAYKGNAEYLDHLMEVEKKYRRKYSDELTADQRMAMHCEAIALGILKDWEDVGVNGETPVYTTELGAEALKQNPALLDFVKMQSGNLDRFEREIKDSESAPNECD